jgi:hypothetical protein
LPCGGRTFPLGAAVSSAAPLVFSATHSLNGPGLNQRVSGKGSPGGFSPAPTTGRVEPEVADAVLTQRRDFHYYVGLFLMEAVKCVMEVRFGFLQQVDVFNDIGIFSEKDDMMA